MQWKNLSFLKHFDSVQKYEMTFHTLVDSFKEPLGGSDKVYRVAKGLKPAQQQVCLVDPSKHTQVWTAEDFEKLVQLSLITGASLKSLQLVNIDDERRPVASGPLPKKPKIAPANELRWQDI